MKDYEKIKDMLVYEYDDTVDIYKQFIVLNTLSQLNFNVYKENDFEASCNAYTHIVPCCEKLLEYISKEMNCGERKLEVSKFANTKDKLSSVIFEDGSCRELSYLEYLYNQVYLRQMAIASRYFIKYNIQYLERNKTKKDYPSRERILEGAIWWSNQMLLGKFGLKMPDGGKFSKCEPRLLIFSTFPSSGKSYLCNTVNEMFSELACIKNKSGGVLRVGNEQTNIFRQSRQTMNLIENNSGIFDIYPENKEFINKSTGKYYPFNKNSEEEWGMAGCCFDPCTNVFKTRDSAINSVRCDIGMFDDPSRGQQECNNIQIHKDICNLFNGDFSDRFKSQDDTCIFLTGTMFNPEDVFSTEIDKAMENGYEIDERFRCVYVCEKGTKIVVLNDCEDEYGRSAYPEFISNEALMEKKRGLPTYDYQCIWRQKPIPADGLLFALEFLRLYDEYERKNWTPYAKAYIDPTRRRARDFFAMPIVKYNTQEEAYDVMDCIFEQSSSRDLYDKIVYKIGQNRIIELYYEENIDNSLGDVIKQKLDEAGITFCKVIPVYNTVNKVERITDVAETIKRNFRFPSRKLCPERTSLGYAVRQLTEFNGDKSEHDDFPDAMAGLATAIIINSDLINKVKSRRRIPL